MIPVIFQGAALANRQQVAPWLLQLSQRKKLNRQHNQPRNLGHIAVLKADWSWQLLPSFANFRFPAGRPDSQRLRSRVKSVNSDAEMVRENKG